MSTLRKAIQSLHTMGILDIRHGDGTYVSDRTNDVYENPVNFCLAMGDLAIQMPVEDRGIFEPGDVFVLDLAYHHLIDDIVAVRRPRSKTKGD